MKVNGYTLKQLREAIRLLEALVEDCELSGGVIDQVYYCEKARQIVAKKRGKA